MNSNLIWLDDFISDFQSLFDCSLSSFQLHEPYIDHESKIYVQRALDDGWVSTAGKFIDEFEVELAQYCGVAHCVSTVNGTAALQLALQVLGIMADEEIFVPSFSFIATANAVTYTGAVPHFVDISRETLGICADKLQKHIETRCDFRNGKLINKSTRRKISAIIPMHTFGHPVDMQEICEIAKRYNLFVVEDAAEALGSTYQGKKCGSLSDIAAVSFNGNKIITTGGGGAILTNDPDLATRARHLSTTAKLKHPWEFIHNEIGYNYRMPNLNAALGLGQLKLLETFLRLKRKLAAIYAQYLHCEGAYSILTENKHNRANYWLNALILDQEFVGTKDAVLQRLHSENILARPAWKPIHLQDKYLGNPCSELNVTNEMYSRIINLPSSVSLALNCKHIAKDESLY